MKQRLKFKVTAVELFILWVIAWLGVKTMFFSFFRFPSLIEDWVMAGGLVCMVLVTKHRVLRGVLALVAAFALVPAVNGAVEVYRAKHLSQAVSGKPFKATPLPQVIQYLARQSSGWPEWPQVCFSIEQEELAQRTVDVNLPPKCTLKDALDLVCQSTQCEYSVHWGGRMCSYSTRPPSVHIYLGKGSPGASYQPDVLDIYQGGGMVWPHSWRANSAWIVPTNLPPATFSADR